MPGTISPIELYREISAQETELRQSISLAVNTLAAFEQARQELGWFGWIAEVYAYRSVRRLRQRVEKYNCLLAFNREIRALLDLVEEATS